GVGLVSSAAEGGDGRHWQVAVIYQVHDRADVGIEVVIGATDQGQHDGLRAFTLRIVDRSDDEVGRRLAGGDHHAAGQVDVIDVVGSGPGHSIIHRQRVGSIARARDGEGTRISGGDSVAVSSLVTTVTIGSGATLE